MSTKGGKARFAPGGREYEKRKAQNKRRGPGRKAFDENDEQRKKKEDDEESSEGEESEGSNNEEGEEEKEKEGSASEGEKDEELSDDEEGEDWKSKPSRLAKPKGLQGIIDVDNPNREQKAHIKPNEVLNLPQAQQPSRREKEAIEKQRQQQRVERSDLARLAQIRKEREAAAKKREEEQKTKDSKSKEGIKK